MTPIDENQDPRRLIARLAVAVMAADGRITQGEMDALTSLDRLGLGPLSDLARDEIERAVRQPIEVRETCTGLASLSPEAGSVIVLALASIATADRVMAPEEEHMLDTIARLLGLEAGAAGRILDSAKGICGPAPGARPSRAGVGSEVPEHVEPPAAPVDTVARPTHDAAGGARSAAGLQDPDATWAFGVLGVGPSASHAEIDAAYLRLVGRYDPAKVLDLGPEFARLAVHRLAEGTAAYETLVESLGTGRSG